MTSIKELKADKLKFKSEPSKYIEIINLLGHKYREHGRYQEALAEHLEAIDVCRLRVKNQMMARELEGVTRRALGECYSELSNHLEAEREHKNYLRLALEMNDPIEVQRAHATIGRTYLLWAQESDDLKDQRKRLHRAEKSFQEALELCENLQSSNRLKQREYAEMRSRLLLNLGLVYETMGDYHRCQDLLFESIELTKTNFLPDELFRCQISLGAIHEKTRSFKEALKCYEQALETSRNLKSKLKQFDAHLCIALLMLRTEDFDLSRKHLKKAFKLNIAVEEDKEKVVKLLKISGKIRDEMRLLRNETDLEKKILMCDHLGDLFVEIKCYPTAVKYYKEELHYATEAGKPDSFLSKIYVSIGQTCLDDGQFEEAIEHFTNEYHFNLGNRIEQCRSLLKVADIKESLMASIDEFELERKGQLQAEIVDDYSRILENFDDIDLEDRIFRQERALYTESLQSFFNFLEANNLEVARQKILKEKFLMFSSNQYSDSEDEPEEINVNHDVSDSEELIVSSDSDDQENDEEIPGNFRETRPKRVTGKSGKLNQFGETPLHTACITGNLAQVERLIEQKVNLSARDYCGWTPLHEACNHGHLEIVEALLKAGANIEACDDRSERITPLHDACNCGHFSVIRILLRHGADVLALNSHRETPVECLIGWRQRTSNELSQSELEQCLQIENQLMKTMKEKGFNLDQLKPNRTSYSQSQKEVKTHRPRNLTSDSLYSRETHSQSSQDIDNPNVARNQYRNTMESLRRNRWGKTPRPVSQTKAALINEETVRDDWLIDDLVSRKKMSSTGGSGGLVRRADCVIDDHRNRGDQTGHLLLHQSDNHQESITGINRKKMSRKRDKDEVIYLESKKRKSEEEAPKLIEPVDQLDDLDYRLDLNPFSAITTTIEEADHSSQIAPIPDPVEQVRVVTVIFDDMEKTNFGVPVLDQKVDFKWLGEELIRRYFVRYGIKPVITLKTSEGVSFGENDAVLDTLDHEASIKATINSWVVDPAEKRYSELCQLNSLSVDEELQNCLKIVALSGYYRIRNSFLPAESQIKVMFQSLFRQDIKEMDLSYSNYLTFPDTYSSFKTTLTSLSTLEVLHLSGVAFPAKHLIHLLNLSPVLKRLDLSFNSIGDEHSYTLAQIIKLYYKLEQLNLSGCDLSDHFATNKLVTSAVQQSSHLKSLILDCNDISDELIRKFKALEVNRHSLNL